MRVRKILVVDDDPNIASVIKQYFDRPGYDVCTMLEGEKVPETVFRIKPDLILLDLRLPDVYGMDVLKDLKKRDFQAPVVIITGNVSAGVDIEAMKEGAPMNTSPNLSVWTNLASWWTSFWQKMPNLNLYLLSRMCIIALTKPRN